LVHEIEKIKLYVSVDEFIFNAMMEAAKNISISIRKVGHHLPLIENGSGIIILGFLIEK
jgi:hypothetical protein